MAAPTNTTPETAIEILYSSLPDIRSQTIYDAGTAYNVFYKLVNDTGQDQVYTVWGYGNIPGTLDPLVQVYQDEALDEFIANSGENLPMQLPIISGTTHWFKFIPDADVDEPLNINISAKPVGLGFTAGQLMIPGASTNSWMVDIGIHGLFAGFIDPDAQEITNFIPIFPVGEYGAILPNGKVLMGDEYEVIPPAPALGEEWLNLYSSSDLTTLITRFTAPTNIWGAIRINSNQVTGKFWCCAASPGTAGREARYWSVSDAGVMSAIQLLPTGILGPYWNFTVNIAETILYFPTNADNIKRWDMVGLAWLSDLAATVTGYEVADILTLDDDKVVAFYQKTADVDDMFIRIFNPDTTVFATYVITAPSAVTSIFPRLTHSATADRFWIWLHLSSGFGIARRVIASTGVYDKDSTTPDLIQAQIETATPSLIYTSDSCPVFEMRASVIGTGSIIVNKVVSPEGLLQEFNFTTDGLTPTEFTLSDGETEEFIGLEPGEYGISEIVNPNYTTEYSVSNGDPHDAIVLEAGETVIVTVTNTLNAESASGIYKIVPGKRNDTLWDEGFEGTHNVKIPNPFGTSGFIGD